MSENLSEYYSAYVNDRSLLQPVDARPFVREASKRRTRRSRRRRDTVANSSDESESDAGEEGSMGDVRDTTSATEVDGTMRDMGLVERIAWMSNELAGHVEYVQDQVDVLAGSGGGGIEADEVRGVWRMLAFALDDWRV
jgi:hypothetical protein